MDKCNTEQHDRQKINKVITEPTYFNTKLVFVFQIIHSIFKVNESNTFDNYSFPPLNSKIPYHFITKAKASSTLLFLQYYKETKSMPLHFGLDPTEAY